MVVPVVRSWSRGRLFFPSLSVAILVASSVVGVLAQQNSQSPVQWNGPDGNYPFNWDYVNQSVINPSNAQNLQVNWIWPVPTAPLSYAGSSGADIVVTPVVVDGISYEITEYHLLIAQNLATGSIIWEKALPPLSFKNLETIWDAASPPPNNITGHYHAIWYTSKVLGGPSLWLETNNDTIYAFNALTGDLSLKLDTLPFGNLNVPGNFGLYGTQSGNLLIDEGTGTLMIGARCTESAACARGFFAGYDLNQNPPKRLWQTFIIPPQDGSDPNWDISSVQSMSYAWIFNPTNGSAVNLKTLSPAEQHTLLYGDWGNFGFNGTKSFAGAGTAWGGSWALDPATHIAYLTTDQASPDWNGSTRPGPNLWSDSILAIDSTTGKIVWAFQTTAHDNWDFDCSWSVMLANVNVNGQMQKVVYKGCKNGLFYALDAGTGRLLWSFKPPNVVFTRYTQLYNPLDSGQMRTPWANYPSTAIYLQNPCPTGGIESDPAYDPARNLVFVATYNCPTWMKAIPVSGRGVPYGVGGSSFPTGPTQKVNTTVWALDGSTGKAVWSYFIDSLGYRGGITVSGGILYVPRQDGFLTLLNAANGGLVRSIFIGSAMITQPAIASDSNGQVHIVLPASDPASSGNVLIGAGIPASSPGFLFALGLGQAAAPQVITTTLTSTVTSVPGQSGVEPTLFYSAVAVAALFIIISGVLARRKLPKVM